MAEHNDSPRKVKPTGDAGFMAGGGEMSERMRALDWSRTSLGPVGSWPQSLRTTLSILLHSRVPMFLYWGPEFTSFYNDAFRPSLGNDGKHPLALGKRGEEVWPEIWGTVKPWIDQVLSGEEGIWMEDQLVPYYRNGRLEDIYWTFSYSPVRDESGQVSGVLVICNETTQQVEGSNQLRQSEQRFQNLVREAATGIVVLHGEEMRVDVVNEAYGRLIGRTAEQLLHKPLFGIIPEAEEPFRPILDKVRLTGEPVHLYGHPYMAYGTEGEKIEGYIDIVYQPYRETDGSITGVMALITDVTEQTTTKHLLLESEARYRSLIEQSTVATAIYTGSEMRIEYANEAMLNVMGKDSAVIGKTFKEAMPELEGQPFYRLLDQVYTTGQTYQANEDRADIVVAGKLQTFYFNFAYKALRNSDGEIWGILNMAVDVTEQVKVRKQLEAQQGELQRVFEQAPVAIGVFKGADYVLEVVNPPMRLMLNKPLNQLVGKPFFEAMPELVGQGLDEMLKQVRQTGVAYVADEQAVQLAHHPPGTSGYYTFTYQPLYLKHGQTEGIICIAVDVTDQVLSRRKVDELNQELAAANEELQGAYEEVQTANEELTDANGRLSRANADMDNFIYTASHDLRAPIHNIESLLNALREDLPADTRQSPAIDKLLGLMHASVERFQRTIRDLTEITKLQRETTGEDVSQVYLSHTVEDVMLDLSVQLKEAGADVSLNMAGCEVIHFSPKNSRSVVYNLLSNALKYRAPDRPLLIKVSCSRQGGYQVLAVEDNGLGLSLSDEGKIFAMFKRLHDHVEGSGVGLYMVKKIMDNAGGKIEVESKVGQGSTFRVYFPAK